MMLRVIGSAGTVAAGLWAWWFRRAWTEAWAADRAASDLYEARLHGSESAGDG